MIDFTKIPLGKDVPLIDSRTLKMNNYLQPLVHAPRHLDDDKVKDNKPLGNLAYGDCVRAMKAHAARRFEMFEQKKLIQATERETLEGYWREQGWKGTPKTPKPNSKYDNGLVELTSLNDWRKNGIIVGGRNYCIYAHGDIHWMDSQELADTIFYLNGACCGVALPKSAQAQTGPGKVWDAVDGPDGEPGSWGLHGIYVKRWYDLDSGLWKCITWGEEQLMTTAFVNKCFDEAHAVVDNRDRFLGKKSPLDLKAMDKILKQLAPDAICWQN